MQLRLSYIAMPIKLQPEAIETKPQLDRVTYVDSSVVRMLTETYEPNS